MLWPRQRRPQSFENGGAPAGGAMPGHDDEGIQDQAQLQDQAHGPPLSDENGKAVFGAATGASVTDKQTYEQAMEAIWGGGGEATGLTAKQFKDELFEKAAQRIFTDTSYRSIVHNL